MITARLLILAGILAAGLPAAAPAQDAPAVKTAERRAPWGALVERSTYYKKDGKTVLHGVQELFTTRGELLTRTRYHHGDLHGQLETFYEGIGKKSSETSYAQGEEDGISRYWGPDGKLLFEGTWKEGQEWDGWFYNEGSSSAGVFHDRSERLELVQWRDGKKVPGGKRVVKVDYRDWKPGTLPDLKRFSRRSWAWYRIKTDYPFYDKEPTYADVPALIGFVEKKGKQYDVAFDQLVALTRMQFGNPFLQKEKELAEAAGKWRAWWDEVGKHRPRERQERGARDQAAWDLARRGRALPLPARPVVLPKTYALTVTYRSGDYEGVISETMTLKRDEKVASLVRRFSTKRQGPVRVEQWGPIGIAEADRVTRALGYLLDQPWLLNDEVEIEKRFWAAEKAQKGKKEKGAPVRWILTKKIVGRESYHIYYPNVRFELRDGAGKLWWNADPHSWHGGNPQRFNWSCQPVDSTVFPFLAARYPESKRWKDGKGAGWVVEKPE